MDNLTRHVPLPFPPEVLAFRAQEILKQLGYPDPPVDRAFGFNCCDLELLRSLEREKPMQRDAILRSNQPPAIGFWYRQHQQQITPVLGLRRPVIFEDAPPNNEPGMMRAILDPTGRLIALEVRPRAGTASPAEIDPISLFNAAGLDSNRFVAAAPQSIPPMAFDQRLAWTGTYDESRPQQIHVEAAFWAGRPVYFQVGRASQPAAGGGVRPAWLGAIAALVFLVILGGSAIVARRNARLGRGDRRGAFRLAVIGFLLIVAEWGIDGPHVADFWELALLVHSLSFAAFGAGLIWALYLAVEPYIRRHWPDALISWTRILSGSVRNPLVASHIMAGVCLQTTLFTCLGAVTARFLAPVMGAAPELSIPVSIESLQGGIRPAAAVPNFAVNALAYVIAFVLIVVLLRLVLRKVWIADAIGSILIGSLLSTPPSSVSAQFVLRVYFILGAMALLWLLRRFGLLAMVASVQTQFLVVSQTPGPWDSWFAKWSALPLALILIVAAWALWMIVSAQRPIAAETTP